ncbi:MAG: GAF domain-containing sensor histidine kinase [Anaerolineales bacterium]|nr:GAF domain-containing sensor histidine kinase [Anaerolineales bacterium]
MKGDDKLVEQLDVIYRLGRELILLRDEAAIGERVLKTTADLLQVEGVGYGLVNELTGELEYAYHLFAPPGQTVDYHQPLKERKPCPICLTVVRSGQAINVADITKDNCYVPTVTDWLKRSVLAVPMRVGQRIIGALNVARAEPNYFDVYDQQLLQMLADQTAVALENARLFKAEQSNREQAQLLREATAALTSLDSNQVLDSILTYLEQVVPYDEACIFLWEEADLRAVAGRGNLVQEQVVGQRYPVDSNLLREQVGSTNHALMLVNTFLGLHNSDYVPGWMSVPLRVRGEVIGYLTLDSQRRTAYIQAEVALAQAFANQAAVAIHNARLFEQVRAGREQLQFLSRRLVEVQETERRHIARELHDEAGQALTSLMVGLRLLEREADSPTAVLARAAELKRMADSVLENLHRLAMDLRPASLDHVGLVAALNQYVERFGRQHSPTLVAQFKAVGFEEGERLPPLVETTLYRIVQEAFTNVVKHAQANHLDVLMKRRDERVVIVVEDDGVGFDFTAALQNHHLGLLGMRERAEMLGGCLMVESTPGSGTTLYVEVPGVYSDSHC